MHSIVCEVKRNAGEGKYKFFQSICQISNDLTQYEYCELTFEFLQFKIHWNLKSDYENEMFYEKCKTGLTEQRNNLNHSLKKCFKSFQFYEYEKTIEKGIVFKIQISASTKELDTSPSNFKGLSPISIESSGNLYKYFYASEKSFDAAKQKLEIAKQKGYSTAFIIAYKDGIKISLTDAIK